MARNLLRFSLLHGAGAALGSACAPHGSLAQQSSKVPGGEARSRANRFSPPPAPPAMDSTAEEENAARTSPAGEKFNACRTRLSCRLFGKEFRQPACPRLVRWAPREFRLWCATCEACRGKPAAASLSGDPETWKSSFLWPVRVLAVSHGERRGRLHRLRSFQLRQHPVGQPTFERAITDPNRNLDPRRRTVIVTTADGQTLTGIARNEDNFSLQLQTADGTLHLLEPARSCAISNINPVR